MMQNNRRDAMNTKSRTFWPFISLAANALSRLDAALDENWRATLVHIAFGAFMGSLALLLILTLAGVPIVGS
jgi:hypothetical protein